MGFHLWKDCEFAWAQGTYEYRPMGVAVIAASDLFHPRDFNRARRAPGVDHTSYIGQFASIGHLNQHMRRVLRAKFRT